MGAGRGAAGRPRKRVETPLKGPWTLPNFITLVRLAALPFFLVSIAGGRFGIALAIFVAAGLSDGVDGYPRAALRHEVGARRLPRPDRRQAAADDVVPVPRDPVLPGPRQGAGLAGGHGAVARLPPDARRAAADPDLGQEAVPADVGRQGHDRDADRERALRPLRQHLGLAAAGPARSARAPWRASRSTPASTTSTASRATRRSRSRRTHDRA